MLYERHYTGLAPEYEHKPNERSVYPDAVSTAAVILAGGRGTRSADPRIPKIAQTVGGQPLMQWHLDLISQSDIHDVLVVTGHLGDQVAQLVEDSDAHGLEVRIIHEAEQRGTVPAVQLAATHTESDGLLVILGDVWASFPIDAFLRSWRESDKNVAAAVHPSLHPTDSDAVIPQPDGSVSVISKVDRGTVTLSTRNMSAAGVFALTRSALAEAEDTSDIGSELIATAASHDDLCAVVSSHYFKDTGTPIRLGSAQEDWESGAFHRRGSLTPRPALFLDRDGVINPALPEVYTPDALALLPGVAEGIAQANALGVPVLVATNQPGLAKGLMTEQAHEEIRARLDELLIDQGAFIDDYAYCPHHPESGFAGEVDSLKISCHCRKPAPGLILDLAKRHTIDRARSVMVGDSDRDEGAAQAAGMRFERVLPDEPAAQAIQAALRVLQC